MPTRSATRVEELLDDDRITAVGLFAEAFHALARELGREMETDGAIPVPWYAVLVRLGRSSGGRLRMTDLAGAVALTTSGTTRLVDRIEAAGLITRQPCAEDRRVAYAALTDEGWKALARATPAHLESIQRHLVDVLTTEELSALAAALRKVRDANWRGPGSPVAC